MWVHGKLAKYKEKYKFSNKIYKNTLGYIRVILFDKKVFWDVDYFHSKKNFEFKMFINYTESDIIKMMRERAFLIELIELYEYRVKNHLAIFYLKGS